MLDLWHLDAIAGALNQRGWAGPDECEPADYFEGRVQVFRRGSQELRLSYQADLGEGYKGDSSLEEVVAGRHRLWLHRTENAKWKRDLVNWADAVSVVPSDAR